MLHSFIHSIALARRRKSTLGSFAPGLIKGLYERYLLVKKELELHDGIEEKVRRGEG